MGNDHHMCKWYLRQWLNEKSSPAQVAMGETTMCTSGVFVSKVRVLALRVAFQCVVLFRMLKWSHPDFDIDVLPTVWLLLSEHANTLAQGNPFLLGRFLNRCHCLYDD